MSQSLKGVEAHRFCSLDTGPSVDNVTFPSLKLIQLKEFSNTEFPPLVVSAAFSVFDNVRCGVYVQYTSNNLIQNKKQRLLYVLVLICHIIRIKL